MKQVRPGLNRFIAKLQSRRSLGPRGEDSVESQAEALRIWMWASAAALALIVVATVTTRTEPAAANEVANVSHAAMSDQIPIGFVLVPIEPTNLEALDSMFDLHGFADLYRVDGIKTKGRRIARGVPLVRSPRNPRRFAVLMPDSDSERLPELSEPVLVILRKAPFLNLGKPSKERNKSPRRFVRADLIEESPPELIQLND